MILLFRILLSDRSWHAWFMLASTMEVDRIASLLEPFLGSEPLPANLAGQLQAYLDLLLRWNARMNLTAVRDPDQIVTRHFGESLFAARLLLDIGALPEPLNPRVTLADVGSGAGFPGVPIKLFAPDLRLTLIESQNKKATFLREVIRTLAIPNAEVYGGRAEAWNHTADVVTLRAVEKFEAVLPTAATLVTSGAGASSGMLCLLVGSGQQFVARQVLGTDWAITGPIHIPESVDRVVLVGKRMPSKS